MINKQMPGTTDRANTDPLESQPQPTWTTWGTKDKKAKRVSDKHTHGYRVNNDKCQANPKSNTQMLKHACAVFTVATSGHPSWFLSKTSKAVTHNSSSSSCAHFEICYCDVAKCFSATL